MGRWSQNRRRGGGPPGRAPGVGSYDFSSTSVYGPFNFSTLLFPQQDDGGGFWRWFGGDAFTVSVQLFYDPTPGVEAWVLYLAKSDVNETHFWHALSTSPTPPQAIAQWTDGPPPTYDPSTRTATLTAYEHEVATLASANVVQIHGNGTSTFTVDFDRPITLVSDPPAGNFILNGGFNATTFVQLSPTVLQADSGAVLNPGDSWQVYAVPGWAIPTVVAAQGTVAS